ncbi:MAG: ImmA/IrrE family metallo-endopeptidase [Lachnospiraceae bacterium]|nr:ImmA/IrrE family metallo-endopeptidase [Lachnospiraceae bacterium]
MISYYKNGIEKAMEVFVEYDILQAPVCFGKIFSALSNEIRLLRYSEYMRKCQCSLEDTVSVMRSSDGACIYKPTAGKYLICFNDVDPRMEKRERFTIAHELGHYFLGHLEKAGTNILSRGELSDREYLLYEREADVFARNLLSPAPLAYKVFYYSSREDSYINLQKVFGISYLAAVTRLNCMDEDLAYYSDPMTQACYKVDLPFKKVCSSCGTILEDQMSECPYCCSSRFHYEFIDPDKPRRPTPKEMGFMTYDEIEREARMDKYRKRYQEVLMWIQEQEERERKSKNHRLY